MSWFQRQVNVILQYGIKTKRPYQIITPHGQAMYYIIHVIDESYFNKQMTQKRHFWASLNARKEVSEPLKAIVKGKYLSRLQIVKSLWTYIKEQSLQDPTDRRQILCDKNLKNVFEVDRVNMFTMHKLLNKHIFPIKKP